MKRVNKYITDAGYCSRREADRYVEQGRVTINGIEAEIGQMVTDTDRIEVDGEMVGRRKKRAVYIVLNKPVGVTCTTDPHDKTNIVDFIGYKERIFPVGRLDKDSEGLIILTNDGDIVNKILRAGNNNPKEYIVTVDKPITDDFLQRMASGVRILGTKTKPCDIRRKSETVFVIQLTQGLNRQIRRMCEVLGYRVTKLLRVRVMNLTLGNLESGRWRYLTAEETNQMHALLSASTGTEEASDERKASRGGGGAGNGAGVGKTKPHKGNSPYSKNREGDSDKRPSTPKHGGSSYSDYRKRGKSNNQSSRKSSGAPSRSGRR